MVKVLKPLFSNSASGELAGAIQFVCGNFLREKPRITFSNSESQQIYKTKFKEAADLWSNTLTKYEKDLWRDFKEIARTSDRCVGMPFMKSGYNMWMQFYLKFGADGWTGYPRPPRDF